jgi:hypothetical protein
MLEPKLPDKAAVGDGSSPLVEFLVNTDNEHKRQGKTAICFSADGAHADDICSAIVRLTRQADVSSTSQPGFPVGHTKNPPGLLKKSNLQANDSRLSRVS